MGINEIMATIKSYMRKNKIVQKRVAIDLGFSEATINMWLNNKKEPTLYHLIYLMDYLGLELDIKEVKK